MKNSKKMERTLGLVVIISVITVDFSGFVLGLSVDNQLVNARNGKNCGLS